MLAAEEFAADGLVCYSRCRPIWCVDIYDTLRTAGVVKDVILDVQADSLAHIED